MKVTELASGSSGNCWTVERNRQKIMIDLGVPYKLVKEFAADFIIITHKHGDHINKATLTRVLKHSEKNIVIFMNLETREHLKGFNFLGHEVVVPNFEKGDVGLRNEKIEFLFIETSHSVQNMAVHIKIGDERLTYATDCGNFRPLEVKEILNSTHFILEYNHSGSKIRDKIATLRDDKKYFGHLSSTLENHISHEEFNRYLQVVSAHSQQEEVKIFKAHRSETNS